MYGREEKGHVMAREMTAAAEQVQNMGGWGVWGWGVGVVKGAVGGAVRGAVGGGEEARRLIMIQALMLTRECRCHVCVNVLSHCAAQGHCSVYTFLRHGIRRRHQRIL